MERQSSNNLINNNLFKKIYFENNSNNCSYKTSKLLWLALFLKVCAIIYLLINLINVFKRQKENEIKIIISLIKKYFSNEKSIISTFNTNMESEIYLDKYETDIYNNIKNKIIGFPCKEMWDNQREFLNGVVRRFRPKKIVEIGVSQGCASSIILNSIQDFDDSHLYSIDLNNRNFIGKCVKELFPNLLSKWTLYKGNIATKFMENIGRDIDMVLIDSAHFEPGEILDFIIVLPFLREEAVIVMHDIANQITVAKKSRGWMGKRNEWAPYIIFNAIRGEKYFPSGENILTQDIGAVKLDKNQYKYYHDYFRLLGGQWQYFPKEIHIKELLNYFKEYYDNDCLRMFNESIEFNRNFVKKNPKNAIYKENID